MLPNFSPFMSPAHYIIKYLIFYPKKLQEKKQVLGVYGLRSKMNALYCLDIWYRAVPLMTRTF